MHLRGDELFYHEAALGLLEGDWLVNAQHPPLVKELMALAHLALGDTLVADRLPSAVATWLTGLVIALLVWRIGRPGRWSTVAGVVTALVWWALPFAPGRTATLEAVMGLFVAAAQLAWLHAVARRQTRWLLVGGALTGLAAACKMTGAVALLGLVPAAVALRRPRGSARVLPFAVGAAVVAGLAWLFPFVPMEGDAAAAMTTPVTFQLEHAQAGHAVVVAGETHQHAPIWSSLWFSVERLGVPAAAGLVVALLVGWVRHGLRATPVGVTLLGLVLALSLSPVQLPHYQYVWWPLLVALAGAGLAPSSGSRSGRRAVAATVVAALALLPAVRLGVEQVEVVARTQPSGLVLAPDVVRAEVPAGTTLTVWADPWTVRTALPERHLTTRMPGSLAPRALLVDPAVARGSAATDLDLWRSCRPVGYEEHEIGELLLLVRRADPHPAFEPAPRCLPLLPRPIGSR